MITLREAGLSDRAGIDTLYRAAFPDDEGPAVAAVAARLAEEAGALATLSLVADADGQPVGHVAFSPVLADDAPGWLGYLLAPLAIHPGHQRRQLGSRLVTAGIGHVSALGAAALLVYGDPGYYGRFGFRAELATRYLPPHPLSQPAGWQARLLKPASHPPLRLRCAAPLDDPALW